MIERKCVSETDGVEPETVQQNSLHIHGCTRSGTRLLRISVEFNILKLNAFVNRVTESQNLFYLHIVVFYYDA